MRPYPFVDLLANWLRDADHPGITRAQTCAEIGRHEQPAGVRITFDGGWAFLLQAVRTSPDGGEGPDDKPVQPNMDAYRKARVVDEERARAIKPARGSQPALKVGALLPFILETIKRADHPGVTSVEVSSRTGRDTLRVLCADRSTIHLMPVGFFPPGATELAHPAHAIPASLL